MVIARLDVLAVWLVALLGAIGVLVLLPSAEWLRGLSVALAGSVVLTLAIQVFVGQKVGFVSRLVASTLGAFAVTLLAACVALLIG